MGEQGGHEGHFHIKHEGLGDARVDQLDPLRQILGQGLGEEGIDGFGEHEGRDDRDEEAGERPDQPLPEVLEMLEEGHLIRGFFCRPAHR